MDLNLVVFLSRLVFSDVDRQECDTGAITAAVLTSLK